MHLFKNNNNKDGGVRVLEGRSNDLVLLCSVATLGSWRTTAGGSRALQSGAKREASALSSFPPLSLLE